ncbi:hypothetical protein LEM8419_00821 [Neolewinella maritima]|uniref:Peptide O-xylosyltransferase n=1 Tax=Neolewinella maritima TaxID=1383882 RepID=A0ABN8F625_9BACT|nr:beta-1,6-N-acetylglucosaminyltransferase [Neolewinella maritima]CAH0999521.1 hypothetical protein LEM8419_00821 [Neolewinella maritima]
MNLHYLILAHTQAAQLRRLVDRLAGPATSFYINVDAGVDLAPFTEAFRGSPPEVHLLEDGERYATPWGDIGLVHATLELLQRVLRTGREGYCILLSGQDYPLRSNEEIRAFFRQRPRTNYIESFKLPSNVWAQGGLNRIREYKYNLSARREDFITMPSPFCRRFYRPSVIKSWVKALLRGKLIVDRKLLRPRRFPAYLQPYGGEHWWALTTETVRDIFSFLGAHPDYLVYHRDTVLAEEIFLQSIVNHLYRNEPDRIAHKVTFANWGTEGQSGPTDLRINDLARLRKLGPGYLYARKFNATVDSAILDALDARTAISN